MESAEDRSRINNFAIRSFRNMADGDYIMARLAFRNRLIPQFIWSSQQAVEKYLKAILLFNRVAQASPSHDLIPLVQKAVGISGLEFALSDSCRRFVEYLDMHNPIRYLEGSYHATGLKLVDLDDSIWEIRRFCEPPSLRRDLNHRELMPPSSSSKFRLFGGELERIANDKNDPARNALLWNNFRSGSEKGKTVKLVDWLTSVNAPLTHDPELFALLKSYVFFPKAMRAYFENLLRSR